jgi:hypothetical protein
MKSESTESIEIRFNLHTKGPVRAERSDPVRLESVTSAAGRKPSRTAQLIALAIQFQHMIDIGVARDYSDLTRLGCLSRERVSQMMKLNWLAPDIQAEILQSETSEDCISEPGLRRVAIQCSWAAQRKSWNVIRRMPPRQP